MAVTITIGINSYVYVADADTYFATRLYSDAWTSATADNKAIALIMAAAKIDRQRLRGQTANYDQTLKFPRAFYLGNRYNRKYGLTIDNVRGAGWYVEQEVSKEVIQATCEEALKLLDIAIVVEAEKRSQLKSQGVKRFSLSSLSEDYTTGAATTEKLLSLEAKQLLKRYLVGAVPIC